MKSGVADRDALSMPDRMPALKGRPKLIWAAAAAVKMPCGVKTKRH
jgi:hypothetical protein